MTDLDERGYLERHAPANFEFNQFAISISIKLIGAAKEHQIFTNGRLVAIPDGWTIDFPDYFCASSFYLHLTDRGFHVERDAIASHGRQIPLVAYGARGDEARQAIAVAKTVIGELEATYGPYTHDALTMYVTEDLNGGGIGVLRCDYDRVARPPTRSPAFVVCAWCHACQWKCGLD